MSGTARTLVVMHPTRRAARRPLRLVAVLGAIAAILLPAAASAHPLGNFTINHYAAIRVAPGGFTLDVVIDQAEIPAFQERLRLDADEDGDVSDAEADAARGPECATLAGSLSLSVDGGALALRPVAAGLSFPVGAGGLPTLRLVCTFVATTAAPLADGALIHFEDGSYPERIGWREIVVSGDGMALSTTDGTALPTTSLSARLTAYPEDLLAQPLDVRSLSFTVSRGGPMVASFTAPDAQPLPGAGLAPVPANGTAPTPAPAPTGLAAVVPGGVGADIPEIFQATDLSPLILVLALLTAAALGAGHALTPGHGKTLMAAYLVGTRGTPLHAVGLGLSVTVSHTLGILVLAALVAGSGALLPTEVVVRATPIVAAVTIIAIGAWMLVAETRRRRAARPAHAHEHPPAAEHEHEHGHRQGHEHPATPGSHAHGGVVHSHLPPAGTTITWRSLFALGLAGGLIPSVNALLILLGTMAAGRPAFGVVLVVAFGLGMALVMSGVGLAMVFARSRLDRLPSASALGRAAVHAPLVAAFFVFGLGIWLTGQAVFGAPVF